MTANSTHWRAIPDWITFRRTIVAVTVAVFLALFGGSLFWAGWVLNNWGSAHLPVITTEGDIGYKMLISPAETDLLAINGITGDKVAFLPKSDMNMLDPTDRYLFTSHESGSQSGVTRIDLETGETDVIVSYLDHDFTNLDGLLWTPWGTLLVSEEATDGRLYEILNPLSPVEQVTLVERTAFGKRRNEGLAIDRRGYLYGVDEIPGGGIYRFRPDSPFTPAALESGTVEVLVTDEELQDIADGRISARWEPEPDANQAGFARPEDIEIVGETLYVALTSSNQVISIDLSDPLTSSIGLFASADTNAPDLSGPDNLASDPDGNLYIAENITLSRFKGQRNQLWFAMAGDPQGEATELRLVATLMSPRNEFSGILVDSAGERLFTNVLGPDNYVLAIQIVR